jgi:endo-1,4-beta-xylanase
MAIWGRAGVGAGASPQPGGTTTDRRRRSVAREHDGMPRPPVHVLALLVGVLVMGVLTSCRFVVGSAGATYDFPGNELLVEVPPGAAGPGTEITIEAVPEPVGPTNVVPLTAFDLAPATGWAAPLTITIGYRAADVPAGVDESDLVVVAYRDGAWEPVASTLDPVGDTATVVTTELGRFAVGWVGCDPRDPTTCTLDELATDAGLRFGATLEPQEIADADYAGTLVREHSALTPENTMKMYSIQNQRGVWTFAGADTVMAFAEANDLAVRGHTLVWSQDQFTPTWVKSITDPAELQAVTAEHITAVVTRYRDQIDRWDVVNEPLASVGTGPSGSVWHDLLGTTEWIADAFTLAHDLDPTAELWLNEYGTDWVPGKHAALLALVGELVADGVPIDGVGLQTHRPSVAGPDRAVFEQQLRDFTELGLEVAITELDVVTSPTDPDALAKQADAYERVVRACLAVAGCTEITTWGITDATTWLDNLGIFPPPTRPLLFDDSFAPKPAYHAVRSALAAGR